MVDGCCETSLPTLLSNQELKYIYKADEFGLNLQLKSGKCSGGKLSKTCITCLTVANSVGDNLHVFVIGKAKESQCIKNLKYPVATEINEKIG